MPNLSTRKSSTDWRLKVIKVIVVKAKAIKLVLFLVIVVTAASGTAIATIMDKQLDKKLENPDKYMVFSWDNDNSDQPGDRKWEDHFQINPYQWHGFEILVLPYDYTVMWFDGQRVRSGFIVVDTTCRVDEVHEAWAEREDFFEESSHSYFRLSSLYIAPNYNKVNWGDNIPTTHYALWPMVQNHWLEYYNGQKYWKFETYLVTPVGILWKEKIEDM